MIKFVYSYQPEDSLILEYIRRRGIFKITPKMISTFNSTLINLMTPKPLWQDVSKIVQRVRKRFRA